jgi:hypothetical protein
VSHASQKQTIEEKPVPAPAAQTPDAGISFAPAEPGSDAPPNQNEPPAREDAPADRRRGGNFGGAEQRKNVVDRRAGLDRRVIDIGSPTGLERRRGAGRRRSDDRKSAEEGEMSDEQFEFIMAVDTYKRLNKRPFPTWTEVLEVVKQLGYRKVAPSSIKLPNANGRAVSDP